MPMIHDDIVNLLRGIYPFKNMEPQYIDAVMSNSTLVSMDAGTSPYEAGDPAMHLFLVLKGTVDLVGRDVQGVYLVSSADSGFFFGYEMLMENARRTSRALCRTDADLLMFTQDQIVTLMSEIPWFMSALEVLSDSANLAQKLNPQWLSPNENILFIARRHPMFLFLRLLLPVAALIFIVPLLIVWATVMSGQIFPLIVLAVALLGLGGWIGWHVIDWRNDYSIVTNQRVLLQERIVLLYDSRQESPMNAVLMVSTETGQIGRIFHYGNVVVRTYAGTIVLPDLRHPQEVRRIVEVMRDRVKEMRHLEDVDVRARQLQERLMGKNQPPQGGQQKPAPAQVEPGSLQRTLASMFQMRMESNGVITYRKHWVILLAHIFFPSLLMIALLVLLVLGWLGRIPLLGGTTVTALVFVLGLFVSGWWLYQYVDWRNDYYLVTNDQVLDVYKKPLGREERRAAPLKNIQTIEFERLGIIGLLFNYGTVYIKVGDSDLTFDEVFNPSEVQRELFKRLAERDYRERQAEVSGEQQRMIEWLQIYHRVTRTASGENLPPGDGQG